MKYRFWGTAPDGTRSVFTYTEIMTDAIIEEYVNDELIDQRPNALGMIPVVHWPNIMISGSPWGAADIADIIGLNREYNEKAVEVSDIINYHSAPVTIVTGAKMSNLERGARKIWAIASDKARVENLEGGTASIPAALEYMDKIKNAMHELTGVPFDALGAEQQISNTSGVALAITYMPMMQRRNMKKITYTKGFQKVNEVILRTLYLYEPQTMIYTPSTEGIREEGQALAIDPTDPLAYRTVIHWPEPLPTDQLIKLNEIMSKMQLQLESRRGALRELGEEFPDEKMEEILDEMKQDYIADGALKMFKARIEAIIVQETGIMPGPDMNTPGQAVAPPALPPEPPTAGPGSGALPGAVPAVIQQPEMTPDDKELFAQLVTLSGGTKLAQRRTPENT